jgi:predicted nucleic acid-binding protein
VTTFIDTSAFLATLDRADRTHVAAAAVWTRFRDQDESLVTSNYILVETSALVQRRLGLAALHTLTNRFLPVVEIHWIEPLEHQTALETVLAAARRDLSLVDCTSFLVMRRRAIPTAFAFDRHFADQGFRVIPQA